MDGTARIVVSDNVSLDGVIEDPVGDEGSARGGWVGLIQDRPELARQTLEEVRTTRAMLMGRRTYEWFAGRWPSRTGELADLLNGMPKFVVSATLDRPAWNNTTILGGPVLDEVERLRREVDGDLVVPASVGVARTLLGHGLVDEVRLKVFPVVLGAGTRLFAETPCPMALHLADIRTLDGDTAALTYIRSHEA